MLELTDGGRCMSGLDAIEFFEGIGDVIEEDAKTEEFCDELTWAINRLRYEVAKAIPRRVRVHKGNFTTYSCGKCAHGVRPGDDYCSKCGTKIGWKEADHEDPR